MLIISVILSMCMLVEPAIAKLSELLPGLFVAEHIVEFEGTVSIDCHHPDTPDVYLEMLVTAPDSREHESLILTSIKPSSLHAALLAAGFESGKPLSRDEDNQLVAASGNAIQVQVALVDESKADELIFIPIETWVKNINDSSNLSDSSRWTGLVFAGSILGRNGYAADKSGTLISLTSFGDEVIAPSWTLSPESSIAEPIWIANSDLVPKQHTKVRVRIISAEDSEKTNEIKTESHEPDGIDIDRNP